MTEFKMDTEHKKRWIEALKSGQYKQGRGCLRRFDEYCCLGVLCDVLDKTRWVITKTGLFAYGFGSLYPPRDVFDSHPVRAMLARMNDGSSGAHPDFQDFKREIGKSYSFDEIADFIERYL